MSRSTSLTFADTAMRFHALSDTTRVEIVELLRAGERCVCELMDALGAAQSRLSFYLKVLKEAGLVTDRREGRWIYYTLNTRTLDDMEAFLAHVRTTDAMAPRNQKCCA